MIDDFEKVKQEMIFEAVAKAIKEDPKDWAKKIEYLDFTWHDDEYDQEEIEEAFSKPENQNQSFLVDYLDGQVPLSENILNAYLLEKDSTTPNLPLFRKYFKKGNDNLKKLLLLGLSKKVTDIDLLKDLAFLHEYRNMLNELVQLYLKACIEEKQMNKFEKLVLNFYFDTAPDNYDALHELNCIFPTDSEKGKMVQKIEHEISSEPECIEF